MKYVILAGLILLGLLTGGVALIIYGHVGLGSTLLTFAGVEVLICVLLVKNMHIQ